MATEMLGVSNREEDQMNNEPSMSSKSIVGLIIPPPDIRAIVEKTAQFVSRNGIEFENKIKEKEINNPRFTFLSPTDPYHAYYRAKVVEFDGGDVTEVPAQPKIQIPDAVREHVQQAEFIPKNPPPAYEYTADPSTINAFDLDLMRLTAMFIARNGRQFLTQLMNREVRNYQFDFLKPQHSNFTYFTKLVEQYTKVLIPAKSTVDDLTKSLDYDMIIGDVKYRVAWEKHAKSVKDREDKAVEKEKMAYNSIDWHDFVVTQTVDFQPSETLNLPPLCTQRDVGSRILLQQRTEAAKADAQSIEMDMASDSEDEEMPSAQSNRQQEEVQAHQRAVYEVTQPTPAPPQADTALVRDYDPKKPKQLNAHKALPEKYIISPLTNERISADKLHDHVRYNTVAPQFKDQRDREQMDRQADDALMSSSGTEISRNIAKLAERRTDIFGVGPQGAEQTSIGKKLGENENVGPPRPDARNIWDGQQSTIDSTTRFAQQQAQQERIASIPPPISNLPSIQRPISSSAPIPKLPPSMADFSTPAAGFPYDSFEQSGFEQSGIEQTGFDQPGFEEPAAKRSRLEDSLEHEQAWIQRINGSISLTIATPVSAEWNLDGQPVIFSIDVKSTVTELKTQIQDKTTVPSSKQKLSFDGMFLKDSNSLAFYNMQNGSVIQLQFKERGGRKK